MSWNGHPVRPPHTAYYYTAEQLAEAFGVTSWTIRYLARRGKIPHRRFSERRMRFPVSSVPALIRAGYHMKIE